jgi:hypothetical protein
MFTYFFGYFLSWVYFGVFTWRGEGTLLYRIIKIGLIDNALACFWPITIPLSFFV